MERLMRRLNGSLSRSVRRSVQDVFQQSPLDLRFALQKTLDPRVSFTRASSATFVDSSGVLRSSVTNLLTYSEELDNSVWTKHNLQAFGSGSVANAIAAPNGTVTADKIVESTTTAQHMVYRNTTPEAGKTYVLSFYAKAAERTFVIGAFSGGGISPDCTIGVNLTTGVVVSTAGSPEFTQVTPVGDGWYRIALIKTMVSATGLQPRILMSTNGTSQSYTGDGTSGIYIWGAQLEQSSTVGEYIPTTSTINSAPRFDHNPTTGESLGLLVEEARTNLLLQSENFGTTWTATRASVSTDATLAPSGATTADKLVEDTTATNTHQIQQTVTLVANTTYATSFYIKSSERTELRLLLSAGSDGINAAFNLSTGVATVQANTGSGVIAFATLIPVGNGWYRATATGLISPTSTLATLTLRLLSSGSNSYTGDGTSGLFLWGAQLEAGAFATSYIPTTTAAATRSADVATISNANLLPWFTSFNEHTFYAELRGEPPKGPGGIIMEGLVSGAIGGATLALNNTSTRFRLQQRTGPSRFDAGNNNGSLLNNTINRVALGASALGSQSGENGLLPTTASAPAQADWDSGSALSLGKRSTSTSVFLNGCIARLAYWPTRLANSTLQSITQ